MVYSCTEYFFLIQVRPPQYQNYVYEEDDYQPVNYGLQYGEKHDEGARRFSGHTYGTYAETDLDNPDQPTDYSLRYKTNSSLL